MTFGIVCKPKAPALHDEVATRRRHHDAPGRRTDWIAVLRIGYAPAGLTVEPIREGETERLVDVQN